MRSRSGVPRRNPAWSPDERDEAQRVVRGEPDRKGPCSPGARRTPRAGRSPGCRGCGRRAGRAEREQPEARGDELVTRARALLLGPLARAEGDHRAGREQQDGREQERAHAGDGVEELHRLVGAGRNDVHRGGHGEELAGMQSARDLVLPARAISKVAPESSASSHHASRTAAAAACTPPARGRVPVRTRYRSAQMAPSVNSE